MDNIKSLEGSLLGNIQTYLNEIKENEGDQEALERVQNTYNELLAADATEIDRAINNINDLVNETNLEGYESINFANTLLGEVLGEYETAGLWSEEFL
jgi:peptidoglycan hydrolase CwlO-like protein